MVSTEDRADSITRLNGRIELSGMWYNATPMMDIEKTRVSKNLERVLRIW